VKNRQIGEGNGTTYQKQNTTKMGGKYLKQTSIFGQMRQKNALNIQTIRLTNILGAQCPHTCQELC